VKGEVVIYGAGMSGMAAACILAEKGYRVVVREREKDFGGSRIFNPSTHVTPLDVEATSGYLGIDVGPAFHPVESINLYFHDYGVPLPTGGAFAVERSSRPTSLDALLYRLCREKGVEFEFGVTLRREDLDRLPEGTIIACGLNPEVYDHLGIPYVRWHGWMRRGEVESENRAWIWLDEGITEYGYASFCNGLYYDLLFSYGREVPRDSLDRYRGFLERMGETEEGDWEAVEGAVPLAVEDNPRLFHRRFILCGTISGSMDPFMGFGISGALVSARAAATAVEDPDRAEREFRRFNRNFAAVYRFKHELWYRIRSRVDLLEEAARLLGGKLAARLIVEGIRRGRERSAIPGFGPLGCH
jgi:flavin-dependent dehydrogenase